MADIVNVALLVGNGFDISAGLDTSAKKFIERFAAKHGADDPDSPSGRLAKTINSEGIETWADYEMRIGAYSATIPKSLPIEERVKEYVEAKGVLDAEIVSMIQKESEKVGDDFAKENAEECASSLCSWISLLKPRERALLMSELPAPTSLRYQTICFNYTPLLKAIVETVKGVSIAAEGVPDKIVEQCFTRFVYAHSTINGIPVAGVNDESQIADSDLAGKPDVVSTVIKPKIMQMIGENSDDQALDIIAKSRIMMIFGMSLGDSDKRWWEGVVNNLMRRDGTFAIIFSRDIVNVGHIPLVYRRETQGVKVKLLQASGLMDKIKDPEPLFQRMFVLPSQEVLMIKAPIPAEAIDE